MNRLQALGALIALVLLADGCASPKGGVRPPDAAPVAVPVQPGDPVKDVLRSFVAAVKAKQFQAAFDCVSPKWHQRYASAQAFGEDLARAPLAGERLVRLEQALDGAAAVSSEENRATISLGGSRVTVLTRGPAGWVIDELDAKQ
jgi:hypothetical protein